MQGIAVIALLFAGGCSSPRCAPAQSQSPAGTWTQKAPMPAVRGEVAAAAVGDRTVRLGGGVAGKAVARNEEYDPATIAGAPCAVAAGARPPRRRRAQRQNLCIWRVHIVRPPRRGRWVFEYDPSGDNWQILTPMPAPRASVGVAVLDGKLHVVGGRGLDGVTVATHDVYDPDDRKMEHGRAAAARARPHGVDRRGGKNSCHRGTLAGPADRTGQHDIYDLATDRWTSAAPLPTPRSGVAALLYKDMILVLGGELPPNHTFPENEGYDGKADRWVTLAPMPAGRHGFGGAVIGSDVYFVGGSLTPGGGRNHRPTDQVQSAVSVGRPPAVSSGRKLGRKR